MGDRGRYRVGGQGRVIGAGCRLGVRWVGGAGWVRDRGGCMVGAGKG